MKLWLFGMFLPVFFVFAQSAEAATLYMDPHTESINRGDNISIKIRIDTDEGECINTVDGVITFTENIVPVDTSRGESILSVWLEEPTINKDNQTITFAGGIPNGYCGRIAGDPRLTNTVLELVFAAPGLQIGTTESGNVATIAFGEGTRVLLNDGFGTDASLRLFDASIEMSKTPGNQIRNEWNDRVSADQIPPEDFNISLERTKNAFSNKYFVVFNTTDKQSGIDYYEIMEEPLEEQWLFKWGAADAPWVRAQSPYVLKDQSLNSTIRVRAYDKAGNDYIAVLVPEESERHMSGNEQILLVLIVSGIVLLVVSGVVFVLIRRRLKARADYAEDDSTDEDEEYEYEYEEVEEDGSENEDNDK